MTEPDSPNGELIPWRILQLEQEQKELERRDRERDAQLNKLLWAVVGLAFTVAGAAIAFAYMNGAG